MTPKYHLKDLIRKELLLLHPEVSDGETTIRRLVDSMVKAGFVDGRFADDVLLREKTFPTGLPTVPLAIAMPHADPDYVHGSAVGVAVLDSPVKFGQMGTDGSIQVEAHLVFLLAIKEREKQVTLIGELMGLVQTPSLLESLRDATGVDEVFCLLNSAPEGAS